MKERGVIIIFNDDTYDQHHWDGRIIALDNVSSTAREVDEALKNSGMETAVVPLRSRGGDGIAGFIRQLTSASDSIVFNLCEAAFGESYLEMHVAALMELYGIRFTGSGPLALGLSLNKGLAKDILAGRGIPTARFAVMNELPASGGVDLDFPVIVKPLKEDASIGIDSGAVVDTIDALRERVKFVVDTFAQPAIVEEYIDGREFNVAVMGNGPMTRSLPASEITFVDFPEDKPKICCYEAKWLPDSPFYRKTVPVCPAEVSPSLRKELSDVALKAYEVMGCRDYARVDMRLGKDNVLKVLEVNPNPDISMDAGFARAAKAAGMDYNQLIAGIVHAALERYS